MTVGRKTMAYTLAQSSIKECKLLIPTIPGPELTVSFQADWPFLLVLDTRDQHTGWALLNGPIITHGQQEQFAELRRSGVRIAGISSYRTFPIPQAGDPLDYESLCEVWCHCFREPERFLARTIPRALISVSDFTDYQRISPNTARLESKEQGFDFVYAGATEPWKRDIKNWKLAGQCIPMICREMGFRCLVIGAPNQDFPDAAGVHFSPALPWKVFLAKLATARFLFVPNELDASPRILAESLCLNVPLIVNRKILGGWKYVNRFTGTFFDSAQNVLAAVGACLEQEAAPRDWFRSNYGPYQTGKRLLRLLKTVDQRISEASHVWLAEQCEELVPGQ